MRRVPGSSLWLGHAGDLRDVRRVLSAGIQAVIELALSEAPATLPRELVHCRFPLLDGPGNHPWLLRAAIETVAGLLRSSSPTLLCCGAGMSRSPAVAAAAFSLVRGCSPAEGLALVTQAGPADLSPGLWQDVVAILAGPPT